VFVKLTSGFFTSASVSLVISCCTTFVVSKVRGVRLAKNDSGSVFGSVWQKTSVFGSVSVLPN